MLKKIFFLSILVVLMIPGLLWGQAVQLPQTGQTTCYDTVGDVIPCAGTGQDGEIQAGVAWPNPRFSVSGDCVTDNLTGLMWAKNANLPNGARTWQEALDYVASTNSGRVYADITTGGYPMSMNWKALSMLTSQIPQPG